MEPVLHTFKNMTDALYDNLTPYAIKSLKLIEDYIASSGEDFISETYTFWKKTGPNLRSSVELVKKEWGIAIYDLRDKLSTLPEYTTAVEFLKNTPPYTDFEGKHMGTSFHRQTIKLDHFLQTILDVYLDRAKEPKFDEVEWKNVLSILKKFFSDEPIQYAQRIVLEGLDIGEDKVDFEGGITVRPIEEADVLALKIDLPDSGFGEYYILETKFDVPRVVADNPDLPVKHFKIDSKIVSKFYQALVLYKSGRIHNAGTWHGPIEKGFCNGGQWSQYQFRNLGRTYSLRKDELVSFKEFWSKYLNLSLDDDRALLIALRRLAFASERENLEDKLVDFMIAFEAILLNDKDELSFKLASRGSEFLSAGDLTLRKKIFRFLKKAYQLRSEIVHGNAPKPVIKVNEQEIQPTAFCEQVEEYLRTALRNLIQMEKKERPHLNPKYWEDRLLA